MNIQKFNSTQTAHRKKIFGLYVKWNHWRLLSQNTFLAYIHWNLMFKFLPESSVSLISAIVCYCFIESYLINKWYKIISVWVNVIDLLIYRLVVLRRWKGRRRMRRAARVPVAKQPVWQTTQRNGWTRGLVYGKQSYINRTPWSTRRTRLVVM